jgi:hypothetical protein
VPCTGRCWPGRRRRRLPWATAGEAARGGLGRPAQLPAGLGDFTGRAAEAAWMADVARNAGERPGVEATEADLRALNQALKARAGTPAQLTR